ncbi:MAG: IMP dehydrogenase [Patescibacteria group bacterium]|jgi:IMP dehydrogenase
MKQPMNEALTYDDVLVVPAYSEVRPKQVDTSTRLTRNIILQVPLLSAPMDTVTEHRLAIAIALHGGFGFIHKNMSPEAQAEEVRLVKRYENGFIEDPVTVQPEDKISDVNEIRETKGYKKVPVVDANGVLVGLVTEQDYFLPDDLDVPVKFKMKPVDEITIEHHGIDLKQANRIIREKKLSVLPIVDGQGRLMALVTRKDLEKNELFPLATKDEHKSLRVGGAISVGEAAVERAMLLAEAGVDALVVDVAHGHSKGVLQTIHVLKKELPNVDVIGGNIATVEGAKALIQAGADAVKVGVGPGSICTTRIVAGIGMPQLTAVMEAVKGRSKKDVPIIADGGIRYSGDIVKALVAGAETVMLGGLFAGTDEAPGDVAHEDGKMFKSYRGMGSAEAMKAGSKDRYGQGDVEDENDFIPEGVPARVPYRGPVERQMHQLVGGLRAGMAYIGAETIPELAVKGEFVRITSAGITESHPHSLGGFTATSNYKG